MLTKEAKENAYLAGVAQALEDAGLHKEALTGQDALVALKAMVSNSTPAGGEGGARAGEAGSSATRGGDRLSRLLNSPVAATPPAGVPLG